MTMVIVEQSLNVALAIADRAVFMEKGAGALRRAGPGAGRAGRPGPGRVPRGAGVSGLAAPSRSRCPPQVAAQRRHAGPGHRRAGGRRHPHLPLVPGHQLRPRRARRPGRRAVRAPHVNWHWNFYAALALMVGGRRRPGRAARAGPGAPPGEGAPGRAAGGDHRRRPAAAVRAVHAARHRQLPRLPHRLHRAVDGRPAWWSGPSTSWRWSCSPLLVAALAWFLERTRTGVAVRAAADNPDAARLAGIGVKRVSTIVWALAGGLAAVATILSAPRCRARTWPAPASSARGCCCGPSPPPSSPAWVAAPGRGRGGGHRRRRVGAVLQQLRPTRA